MSRPRIWTLSEGFLRNYPPPLDNIDSVRVIELEPVLDLLERAAEALGAIKHWSGVGPHPLAIPLNDEIAALTERLGDSK